MVLPWHCPYARRASIQTEGVEGASPQLTAKYSHRRVKVASILTTLPDECIKRNYSRITIQSNTVAACLKDFFLQTTLARDRLEMHIPRSTCNTTKLLNIQILKPHGAIHD